MDSGAHVTATAEFTTQSLDALQVVTRVTGEPTTDALNKAILLYADVVLGHTAESAAPITSTSSAPLSPGTLLHKATLAIHDVDCPAGSLCREDLITYSRYAKLATAALEAIGADPRERAAGYAAP